MKQPVKPDFLDKFLLLKLENKMRLSIFLFVFVHRTTNYKLCVLGDWDYPTDSAAWQYDSHALNGQTRLKAILTCTDSSECSCESPALCM